MNFLGYKWYPCVSHWEDKPAHKGEVFRTKDKNLHWSLDWTLEHCTKSECIKKILCFPATPETLPQTPVLWFFQWYTENTLQKENHKVSMCQILFTDLSAFPSETESGPGHPLGRNTVIIFPAVKLDWFSNHNLTDLTEAKGNVLLRHMDT